MWYSNESILRKCRFRFVWFIKPRRRLGEEHAFGVKLKKNQKAVTGWNHLGSKAYVAFIRQSDYHMQIICTKYRV